ncbi:hypothetical protein V8E36_009057 [Tilletia maclaganii]
MPPKRTSATPTAAPGRKKTKTSTSTKVAAAALHDVGEGPSAKPSSSKKVAAEHSDGDGSDTAEKLSEDGAQSDEVVEIEEKTAAKSKATAQISLLFTPRYRKAKKAKQGAGRPSSKAKTARKAIELEYDDDFDTFKKAVIKAAKSVVNKIDFKLTKFTYDDMDVEGKVPKGSNFWKKPWAIDSKKQFESFHRDLRAASDHYGECTLTLIEDESDSEVEMSDEDAFSSSGESDLADNSTKPKGGRKSNTATAAKTKKESAEERLQKRKIETMKAVNERWKCKEDGCNIGGHCIVDRHGTHYPLTKSKKDRYVRSICEVDIGSVEVPPRFLFDAKTKPRGRSGPRASLDRSPQHTSGFRDVTIILSSPAPPGGRSAGSRQLESASSRSLPHESSSNEKPRLKKTIDKPIEAGDACMTIKHLGHVMNVHPTTINRLHEHRFVRVSQLARVYTHNFDSLLSTFAPSPAELADVEDMLLRWSDTGQRSFAKRSPSTDSLRLSFRSTQEGELPDFNLLANTQPSYCVKRENGPSDEADELLWRQPSGTVVKIGREDAIELLDSSSIAHNDSELGSRGAASQTDE